MADRYVIKCDLYPSIDVIVYVDESIILNPPTQSAVDFSFLFCLRFQAQTWFNPLNLGKRLRTLLLQEITTI